jgi:hypothetical protein
MSYTELGIFALGVFALGFYAVKLVHLQDVGDKVLATADSL